MAVQVNHFHSVIVPYVHMTTQLLNKRHLIVLKPFLASFFCTLGIRATLFMGFLPSSFCKMERERTHYISDIIFVERVGRGGGGGDVLTELTELMCFTLTSSF